ncbi:hypothetical protein [Clostridium sp. LP20]|uniref:hypothetical protein n=1 Tax=Clostridium sp. LP20 TaxID=3418665 RepID=UPI003EE4BFA0
MSLMGIQIYSDLDGKFTRLLTEKLSEYLKDILGNLNNYSKYITSISFKKFKEEESTRSSYNLTEKKIDIIVGDKLPLVYDSIYHQILHSKNNYKSLYNINLTKKYPFIHRFIDQYISYSKTMEFMINKELKKNDKLCNWYIESITEVNKSYDNDIYENLNLIYSICMKGGRDSNCSLVEEKELSRLINIAAYNLAKINSLKINCFDIRLSGLLIDLDSLKSPISGKDCRLIESAFEIIHENISEFV